MRRFPWTERLGLPGLVGAVLLLACAVFFVSETWPARSERDDLMAEREQLSALALAGRGRPTPPPVQTLPPVAQAPELLKRLDALAQKDGVPVTRSSYRVKTQEATRIYEIDLPLKAAYPMLRAYLRDVLALSPTARLDDLDLHRATGSDPDVEADVHLSFTFAGTS